LCNELGKHFTSLRRDHAWLAFRHASAGVLPLVRSQHLLQALLRHLPTSVEEFNRVIPKTLRDETDPAPLHYLPNVIEVIAAHVSATKRHGQSSLFWRSLPQSRSQPAAPRSNGSRRTIHEATPKRDETTRKLRFVCVIT